ncbi:MAG TPA: hypothetical protein VMH22_14855 [bacterium]|nr:hypothetical protein [bacterium]
MTDPAVEVSVRNGTVTIRFPARLLRAMPSPHGRRQAGQRLALRAVRGMWKRRKLDPLAYQREVRGEWN